MPVIIIKLLLAHLHCRILLTKVSNWLSCVNLNFEVRTVPLKPQSIFKYKSYF